MADGVATQEEANFAMEDAKQKLAEVNAQFKASSLGITNFEQAMEAMGSGALSGEEMSIIGPNIVKDVEDLNIAVAAGVVPAEEYASRLQGMEHSVSDLDSALNRGLIGITAYNNMMQEMANAAMGGEDEFEELVSTIADMNGIEPDKNGKFSQTLMDVARDAALADKAAGDMLGVFSNFGDVLKKSAKGLALNDDEILLNASGMAKLKKATTEMLGITNGSLPDSFYKNTENLKLMEEAANGSEKALAQLRDAAAD
jgi:hypothetical protein